MGLWAEGSGETSADWARIPYRIDATVVNYLENLTDGIRFAKSLNYTVIYWIWWEENGMGLKRYVEPVPRNFKAVHKEGSLVIHK